MGDKDGGSVITINGVKSLDAISLSETTVTIATNSLNQSTVTINKVTVSGGYNFNFNFNFASDYKNATITGSAKADTISTNGKNLLVKGAASKTVTYIESGKTNYYPTTPQSDIILTDNKTTAILRETYSSSTYTAGSKIKKIDASAVTHDLTITGNDTLQGGSGADVFVG